MANVESGKYVSKVKRTHHCGKVTTSEIGKKVTLMGWVDTRRDHGGLVFVDLRDREGIVQLVMDPNAASVSSAKDVRGEYVIAVTGEVRGRPEGMINKRIPTGEVEVSVERCEILSKSEPMPFQADDPNVSEMVRLKYRYLDLRSARMQSNLILRHKFYQVVRRVLSDQGFLEIETPILYKSTPEGARDYLVPSRVSQGRFYALPQSPQTLKQLLMVSGMDRYFQIARCFRDEDLRADRQPEFTQVDIEMSFADVEDVIAVNEKMAQSVWKEIAGVDIGKIPRMTYMDAMNLYGIDKPDLRFEMQIQDLSEISKGTGFRVFDDALETEGAVKALAVPGQGEMSRGQIDKYTKIARQMGAKGLMWIKSDSAGTLNSPLQKFIPEEKVKSLFTKAGAKNGDAVLIVADEWRTACTVLGHLRLQLGSDLKLIKQGEFKFTWVMDFPLFDYDPDNKRWVACHHPFTSPDDLGQEKLMNPDDESLKAMKAKAYDLVCNGYELGGGSIRIHNTDVQSAMFKALGLSPEEIKLKFGFFIDALKYGTPPHGGFAWGVDRAVMLLCGTDAIRDVIAFPKTARATDLMAEAPSVVSRDQLLELGIRLSHTAEAALAEDGVELG